MTCEQVGGVIICRPTHGGALQRQHGRCKGICETPTSRIVMQVRSPWCGPDWMCVDCGDSWSSEGLYGRPFARGWRKKSIASYERLWAAACECDVVYDEHHYAQPCVEHQAVT